MANILVVGPHPDDQELGMGGTIHRLASQGHRVVLLDMTNGEPTPYGSEEQRLHEWTEAAKLLGVERELVGLKNREVEHTLAARHAVAQVIRRHQINIIFCPYEQDAHPDHRATTRIVEDARFDAKLTKTDLDGDPVYPRWLFYYYCTHLRWVADPSFCIDISEHIDIKEQAILAYHSQFVVPEKNRHVVEWVKQMNGYMGSRIGTLYAEPFFTKEPIGLDGIASLVM